MADILVQTGENTRERFSLARDRVSIGRSRESDIFLPDQWLSRHHAEVVRRDRAYYLQDLGSKNGTLLNGEPVKEARRLHHGDVITLGEHILTFSEDVPEDLEAPPEGTRIFSARELSDIKTKPAIDPTALAQQNRVLSILTQASRALVIHRPLPELFETILKHLFDAVPADRAAILLLEGTPPEAVVKASQSRGGLPPLTKVSRSIARRVLEQRVSLVLPNILEDALLRTQDSIVSTGIRAALCAPLWYTTGDQEDVIGMVYLDTAVATRSFTDEDVQIVTALANVAASKIENVRLLEESMEKRRLEQEMMVAAEIQRGLLPAAAPRVPGYEVTGSNRPCRTVGGDYYDFILRDGALNLALGDVSGKGTGAALLMTVLRAAVRTHWNEKSVGAAVIRINETVCQNVTPGKYVTFFMARLDPPSGHLTYVNAGHNPPLVVRANGEVETLEAGGMVLGLFETVPYEEGTVELGQGDLLIVFSDGVTETFNPRDEEFGEQNLIEVCRRERTRSADALQSEILHELDRFAAGIRAGDDRTMIVLKRGAAS